MMSEKEEQAWDECLRLWEKLSEMPNQRFDSSETFKNNVLHELGIEKRVFGCPFCERYINTSDCPLGDCYKTTTPHCLKTIYREWHESGRHDQVAAKKFYEYLLQARGMNNDEE